MAAGEMSQLREKISLEEDAAHLGLSGLASGIARHDFIEARMNQNSERFLQLAKEGKIEQIDREVDLIQKDLDMILNAKNTL